MRIDPAPSDDEIAAILIALQRSMQAQPVNEQRPKPSRWRMAGRDYTSTSLR